MNIYKITIKDNYFRQPLTGTFTATTKQAAIKEVKEYYAMELDTNPENITVLSINKLN